MSDSITASHGNTTSLISQGHEAQVLSGFDLFRVGSESLSIIYLHVL
jgi:hypothetical protein